MRIHPPTVTVGDDGTARLAARIETAAGTRELWFAVPAAHADHLVRHKLDAFLIGLLVPAMEAGEDVALLAPVSERLFLQVTEQLVPLLAASQPDLRSVLIAPSGFDSGRVAGTKGEVATGFFAGVDSFLTYYDRNVASQVPGFRITRFVFTNVGSHGAKAEPARALFRRRLAYLRRFADEVGIEIIPIDSNLADFYRISFVRSHTLRNVAAVAALQGFIGTFLYSTGFAIYEPDIDAAVFPAVLDPVVLPLLSN
ncbi:MAG: hypothetical protein EXQ96_04170 [Alphaproteobacteria bacterium]|nr:hypothetical protein [Alphaproteobacteria bacterium]